jgi:8-oxo-dGTP pyrophosphatase MutT (NUDIX family)
MKKLSIGTIITDNKNILLGHATQGFGWDIPKGGHEDNDIFKVRTAQRELQEEFGISFPLFSFEVLGFFEYTKDKDLYLFKIQLADLFKDIPMGILKCTSYFEKNGMYILEMDKFKIVSIDEIDKYCYKSMIKVLNKIFSKEKQDDKLNSSNEVA